jgi:hypothetical protein
MSEMEVHSVPELVSEGAGLSEWQRVASTFTEPSKTFEDIKCGHRNWWAPLIIYAVIGYVLFAAVASKIGIQQVVDNQIRLDPKAEERMAQATPAQREAGAKISLKITEGVFIASPLMIVAWYALLSLGLWGTINFGFGGKATYGSILSVWMFASLPTVIKSLLGIVVVYAGAAPESFNIKNFAPTNIGAFLNPIETNKALYTLATSLDAVTIWTLVLLGIGTATVAGVKRSAGYAAVFGWWAIFILISVGIAAVTG